MKSVFVRAAAYGLIASTVAMAPSQAQAQFGKPSKGEQVKLGQQAAAQLRKEERVLPDSDPRVQLLRKMGAKMLSKLNLSKEPWQFTFDVIESKEINAFALPGGPVFFYTGIIDRLKTEDEMAGILGHEMTHVTREHWAYAVRDQSSRNGLLALGAIFGAPTRVLQVADLVGSFTDLQFSRGHETQADEQGFDLMVKAGYNPQGMVDVFKMLQSQGGGRGPEFLSTHPDPGNRVKKLQSFVDKKKGSFPSETPLPFTTGAMRGAYDKPAASNKPKDR